MTNYQLAQKVPSAFITKNKQRIRQNGDTVYLQDGETFEIELFNPTQRDLLAKIEINKTLISAGGIILRPGERIFLERYIDTNNKFVFQTYEVENTEEVLEATRDNGLVTISFVKELQNIQTIKYNDCYINGVYQWPTGSTQRVWTTWVSDHTAMYDFSNTNITNDVTTFYNHNTTFDSTIETGKIEKGELSNQQFITVNKKFEQIPIKTVEWRILPKSREVVTSKEVYKRYCTNCGSRIKKSNYKFCPHCGTSVD